MKRSAKRDLSSFWLGGITQGAAVLRVDPSAVTGDYTLRLSVYDNRSTGGQTGTVDFILTITGGTSF